MVRTTATAAVLALGSALAFGPGPAAAQPRDYFGPGRDGDYQPRAYDRDRVGPEGGARQGRTQGARSGGGLYGGPLYDREPYGYRYGGAGADGMRPDRSEVERAGRAQFERGYRTGREDERLQGGRRGGGEGDGRSGASGRFAGPGWNDPWQGEPRERLERAAARLREALVLMQRQPSGRRLDEALDQARQALVRVQNAMTWLPSGPDTGDAEDERRYERRSGRGIGAHRASGGWRS